MIDDLNIQAHVRLECLKLAAPMVGPSEADRAASVAKIASRLYAFIVAGDISAQTSPDRTLKLTTKRK